MPMCCKAGMFVGYGAGLGSSDNACFAHTQQGSHAFFPPAVLPSTLLRYIPAEGDVVVGTIVDKLAEVRCALLGVLWGAGGLREVAPALHSRGWWCGNACRVQQQPAWSQARAASHLWGRIRIGVAYALCLAAWHSPGQGSPPKGRAPRSRTAHPRTPYLLAHTLLAPPLNARPPARPQNFRVDIGAPFDAVLPQLSFEGATRRNRPNLQVGTARTGRVTCSKAGETVQVPRPSHGQEALPPSCHVSHPIHSLWRVARSLLTTQPRALLAACLPARQHALPCGVPKRPLCIRRCALGVVPNGPPPHPRPDRLHRLATWCIAAWSRPIGTRTPSSRAWTGRGARPATATSRSGAMLTPRLAWHGCRTPRFRCQGFRCQRACGVSDSMHVLAPTACHVRVR